MVEQCGVPIIDEANKALIAGEELMRKLSSYCNGEGRLEVCLAVIILSDLLKDDDDGLYDLACSINRMAKQHRLKSEMDRDLKDLKEKISQAVQDDSRAQEKIK